MRISDWSSDVCSSDLQSPGRCEMNAGQRGEIVHACVALRELPHPVTALILIREDRSDKNRLITFDEISKEKDVANTIYLVRAHKFQAQIGSIMNTFVKNWPEYVIGQIERSEEHKSELKSLMRISYAVLGM